ncbi:MAG: ABC transporter permease [Chloroflexota bacterium]|nr:ABC transporter permease [Chloroflexota bacterium]
MAHILRGTHSPASKNLLTPVIRLALWRVRRTWGLLLLAGVGMIAAVMVVCTVPLYSQVAMTAGLRGVLAAAPQHGSVLIQANSEQLSADALQTLTQQLNTEIQNNLGSFLNSAQVSIVMPNTFMYTSTKLDTKLSNPPAYSQVGLVTEPMAAAASHLRLVAGHLPSTNNTNAVRHASFETGADLDVALTPQEARELNAHPGSVIITQIGYIFPVPPGAKLLPGDRIEVPLRLHVVGLFQFAQQNDAFWSGLDFAPHIEARNSPFDPIIHLYTVMASTEAFSNLFGPLYFEAHAARMQLENPCEVSWIYPLNSAHITIDDLDTLSAGMTTIQTDAANNSTSLVQRPFFENIGFSVPSDVLNRYAARVSVVRIPVFSVMVLLIGPVLFFVSMMAELLVERQSEAIALLRSRGTSRTQIFGAFVTQSLGLGLLALIMGPLLAIALVGFLARTLLPPENQGALSLLAGNPAAVVLGVRWYALAAAGIAIIAMALAIMRAIRQDVLSMRQEAARSTHRPLWRRLNLDRFMLVILLVAFGFSLYLTNSDALDAGTRLLLLTPLTMLGVMCLLIAGMLLFLRLFPQLLLLGARLASHNRGAPQVLALAQMARAPGQSLRMTLLLALATAFMIFSLIFVSSQAQRVLDVAAYRSGADFSGQTAVTSLDDELGRQTTAYTHIRGVTAASLGSVQTLKAGQSLSVPIAFYAVDSSAFARTFTWTPQAIDGSSPSLQSLMDQLLARRAAAIAHNRVPAIVDAATASALNLSPDATFTLTNTNDQITTTFVVMAGVSSIPTVVNSTGTSVPAGGVIADFQTYASIYDQLVQAQGADLVHLNYAWLRTRDDAASLASVRATLNTGYLQLTPLYDRRAIEATLGPEPLYLDLIGLLAVGTLTALFLALLGNLLTSWLSARGRVLNFAVMRALGTPPRQVISVLVWEQGIVYITGLLLGIFFGTLLSALMVPALVFSGVPSSGATSDTSSQAFYLLQSIPPVRIIVSPWLTAALAALVVICALALMVRIVSHSAIGQTLRLNED